MRNLAPMLGMLLIGLAVALGLSCATTGPGGQKSLILISSDQEVSIGKEMDQQVRSSEKILNDSLWQIYISEMGQKVVAVSDRKDLPYHFAVIESDQVNAFATPGGFVYVYSGLIREVDQESELAAVMAHEISHVVGRHGIKRLQLAMGATILLDLALGQKSQNTQALAQAALGIILQGYSRSEESEADNFGITYMTRAGWNPNGAVAMFEKLAALSGNQPEGFFEKLSSSHPDTQSRIAAAKSEISRMPPLSAGLTENTPRFEQLKKRLPPPKPQSPSTSGK